MYYYFVRSKDIVVIPDSSIPDEKSYIESTEITIINFVGVFVFVGGLRFRRGVFVFVGGLRFRRGVFVFLGGLRFRRGGLRFRRGPSFS